jgi:signal peptidase I
LVLGIWFFAEDLMSQDRVRGPSESVSPSLRPASSDGPVRRSATATAAKPKSASPEIKDTWREVVETVVFVVVLVLLLKSFTAEAFVIPTGSMAETLWGYQKLVTCPQCGYEFPVNCSSEVEEKPPREVSSCICPNCMYEINFQAEHLKPSCNTGDRVLVAKHLNDTHVRDFDRLDVVVFKFPEEPQRDYVPMNYIKRLIGLPGETIGILNGDIYIAKNLPYEQCEFVSGAGQNVIVKLADANGHFGEPQQFDLGPRLGETDPLITLDQSQVELRDLNARVQELREQNTRMQGVIARENRNGREVVTGLQLYSELPLRRQTHRNYPIAVNKLKEVTADSYEPAFQILRKPPSKVLAVRRIVYDNNHQAKDLLDKKAPPRWWPEKDANGLTPQNYDRKRELAAKDGWVADGSFAFQHKARPGEEVDWLRYRHLLMPRGPHAPPETPELKPITDVMGYNQLREGDNWVGDLIVEFKVEVKDAQGKLIIELSKGADRFRAQWDLSTGTCTLTRVTKDGSEELDKKETSLKKPGTYRLRFANVDERLIVWVDGSLPFGDGVPYTPPQNRDFQANDLEPASIGVAGGAVSVSNLELWRDTYYTNSPDKKTFTLYVQPGHYLCLGDNSPQSSDSRSWDRQDRHDNKGGLVPERLMLGRALLVYWPFWPANNRAGTIK